MSNELSSAGSFFLYWLCCLLRFLGLAMSLVVTLTTASRASNNEGAGSKHSDEDVAEKHLEFEEES